ncbi:S1 family peptidase [Lentzea alba]|uniref:hypothetical protein n=1 Tax=Lentzea alba TaxID=2714351 RepID=UPI0039BF42B8
MKTTRLSALAAIIATAALLASTAPALADEPKSPFTPEVNALMATQDKLHKIAEKVGSGNGFAGVYVDAGSNTLNVYWKGKAPAKVNAAALTARAQGVNIKVHQAKYSQAELKAEATRLAKDNASIAGVAAKYDGSGILVQQSGGMTARSAIQSAFPLDVQAADIAPARSRALDEPPFKGGAHIENWVGREYQGACSSGFGVRHNDSGATKLLTAAHCGDLGTMFTAGSARLVGYVDSRSVGLDTETIPTQTTPNVWIGDSIQAEMSGGPRHQYGLPVVAGARTYPGEWLCTSGAYSGTVCEIRAEQTGLTINITGFGLVHDTVMAFHHGGGAGGGNGDSGGPVFSAVDQRLTARGTLSAISIADEDLRACYGVPSGRDGRKCSARIFFPDIVPQMAYHNVQLLTAP